MMRNDRSHAKGFTLIELMVTVLVVAILAGIALPTYKTQIRKSRRVDAKTALLDLAGREERYFNANNYYTNSFANLGYAAATPQLVGSGYYTVALTVTAAGTGNTYTPPTFTVTANPYTADQLKDTSCLYFSVDNTGKQTANSALNGTGTDTTATCW